MATRSHGHTISTGPGRPTAPGPERRFLQPPLKKTRLGLDAIDGGVGAAGRGVRRVARRRRTGSLGGRFSFRALVKQELLVHLGFHLGLADLDPGSHHRT